MIKLIGAILIISATSWGGFEYAKRLSDRPKQLRLFRDSLQTLEAEIMYGHTPLEEAARRIAVQMPKPISIHYQTFAEKLLDPGSTAKSAWQSSIEEIWHHTALQKTEMEILLQFGGNLGKHDRETEQKQIMLALAHIQREEENALDKQKSYEKMAKSLGVLSGVLFIILLL